MTNQTQLETEETQWTATRPNAPIVNQPKSKQMTEHGTATAADRVVSRTHQNGKSPAPSAIPTTPAATGRESTIVGRAKTPGEEKITSAIVRFVNRFGETNHGVLIGHDESGMVQVHWDRFSELLDRLGGRATAMDRKNLDVRITWCRAPEAGPNGSYTELLPIDTPVDWSCAELWQAQQRAKAA